MKPNRILSTAALAAGIALAAPFVLAGCDEQGPAEKAGEAIDEAAQDAQRAVEDATD
jgi:hypothetical protein